MIRTFASRGVLSKPLATVCASLRLLCHSRMERFRNLAWLPLTLRWRRKANKVLNAFIPGGTRQEISTLQFHLYLVSRPVELLREIKVAKSFCSSIARHSERTVLREHIGRIPKITLRHQTLREVRSWTTVDRKSLPNLRSAPRVRVSPISFSPQETVWLISRQKPSSLDQMRKLLVLSSTRIVSTLRLESNAKSFLREFQIMRFRNLGLQDAVRRRKNGEPALSGLGVKPELVWRTAQAVQNGGIKQHGGSSTSGEQRGGSLTEQAVQLQTAPPSRPATEIQLAKIDSRVLDRLTDDVITRMERRIRIERERRGL
jgi:hypothetical protein